MSKKKKKKSSSKSSSSKSSSKSSSSKSKSSNTKKYQTTDGKKFSEKSDATAHQRKLNAQGKGRGSSSDKSREEDTKTKIKEKIDEDSVDTGGYDETELKNSESFKQLDEDRRQAVLAVFQAIASNDTERANQIMSAFEASTAVSDPFFKQELRLAKDAIERGFVAIDKEEEFRTKQLQRNLADVKQDLITRKDQLSFEEQSALKDIERQYTNTIKETRQNLASTGKTFSSERDLTEQMIEESTGQMRESTKRQFGLQNLELQRTGERTERDTQSEIERLAEVTKQNRLDFLRSGEAKIGTKNISSIYKGGLKPIGDIVGDIPQRQFEDVLRGTQNLIF